MDKTSENASNEVVTAARAAVGGEHRLRKEHFL